MDVQLTLSDKQKLVEIFSEFYSQEEVFSIGRLIGIDKNKYYGYGMNATQLAEVFVEIVVQKEKIQELYDLIERNRAFYRSAFEELISISGQSTEVKRLSANLYAIVIGINEYNLGAGANDLMFAANDAKEIVSFLNSEWQVPDYNIVEFVSKGKYCEIISEIKNLCESIGENDNLLFFFSGHGLEYQGHSYLVVTDTDIDLQNNITNAISLEELNEIIKNCKANLKIRFFDACHCGESFSKDVSIISKMTDVMKKQLLGSGNGWITFCSCDIDECSIEMKKLQHGVFTYCLLNGLNGRARRGSNMYIEDLKIYVCDEVPKVLKNIVSEPQNPQYQCEIEGNIVIG